MIAQEYDRRPRRRRGRADTHREIADLVVLRKYSFAATIWPEGSALRRGRNRCDPKPVEPPRGGKAIDAFDDLVASEASDEDSDALARRPSPAAPTSDKQLENEELEREATALDGQICEHSKEMMTTPC